MAAKKKKKAAKKAPMKKTKAKKAIKKKPAAKKSKKPAKKKVVKAAAKKAPAKKAKKPAKKKKQVMGEGDYAATRAFDKAETSFVKKNKAKIPAMAKAAEAALDGPEGDSLREAEARTAGRSRDTF